MRLLLYLFTLLSVQAETIAHTEFSAEIFRNEKSEVIIGITLTPEEHWHTYWSNPGDAGMSLSLQVEGLETEAYSFPTPERYELGGLVAYGYEKSATFLFLVSGELPEELSLNATWLACDDTSCVPGNKKLKLKVPTVFEIEKPSWFKTAMEKLPEVIYVGEGTVKSNEDSGAQFTFTSDMDLERAKVFPVSENLSEVDGQTFILKEGETYSFSFKYLGEKPDIISTFIFVKDGKGYLVNL